MVKKPASPFSPLLIIGGGKMGSALIDGWIRAGITDIHVVETDAKRRAALARQGVKAYAALPKITPAVTLLAIKPQGLAALAPALSAWYKAQGPHTVVSILAGVTIKRLHAILGAKAPIIRAMPNTPAIVGEGVTAFVLSKPAAKQQAFATELLGVVGDVLWLKHEDDMDAVTALSGSGPAYVFYFLESLIEAGVKLGLPKAIAEPLALQTVKGALTLAEESDTSLAILRENVTSPGGTTEAALKILMKKPDGLSPLMGKVLAAAAKRSRQLGNS